MADTANWEKWIKGEPLNEELAALREGRALPAEQPQAPFAQRQEPTEWDLEKPLTRADMADLRELRNSRGFAVFILLQKRALRMHERSAISRSKQSPLANSSSVAEEWAYLTMYERALLEMGSLLEATIKELGDEGK